MRELVSCLAMGCMKTAGQGIHVKILSVTVETIAVFFLTTTTTTPMILVKNEVL